MIYNLFKKITKVDLNWLKRHFFEGGSLSGSPNREKTKNYNRVKAK